MNNPVASSSTEKPRKPLTGKKVFLLFAAFFGMVIVVNAIFITQALQTHRGVVTEDAYKKGLHYNDVLERARQQPDMQTSVSFKDGVLRWSVQDQDGAPIEQAKAHVSFFRPVQSGMDFDSDMEDMGAGVYELRPEFPEKGAWKAGLTIEWDNKTYQVTHSLVVR